MSTLTKQQELHAMSAEESTSIKHLSSGKPQDSLQEPGHLPMYLSQFFRAKNADMLMENSYRRKFNPLNSYDGLHIYDMEGEE